MTQKTPTKTMTMPDLGPIFAFWSKQAEFALYMNDQMLKASMAPWQAMSLGRMPMSVCPSGRWTTTKTRPTKAADHAGDSATGEAVAEPADHKVSETGPAAQAMPDPEPVAEPHVMDAPVPGHATPAAAATATAATAPGDTGSADKDPSVPSPAAPASARRAQSGSAPSDTASAASTATKAEEAAPAPAMSNQAKSDPAAPAPVKSDPAESDPVETEPSSEAATAATAPRSTSKPEGLAAPRGGVADSLRAIKGLGPKLEEALNAIGIYHYDQIAAWTAAEVAWIDENIGGVRGRASRDDWTSQAAALARGDAP